MVIGYGEYRDAWKGAVDKVPEFPLCVDIELTTECNLACSFCPHDTGSVAKDSLPVETVARIIDRVWQDVPSVKVNLRGESTTYPFFVDACRLLLGAKVRVGAQLMDIRINTNGVFSPLLAEVIAKTFDDVSFSINATADETFKEITGHTGLLVAMRNFHYLYRLIAGSKTLRASFVKTEANAHEADEWLSMMEQNYPRAILRMRDAMPRAIDKPIERYRQNCGHPHRRLTILADGDILPCCVGAWEPKERQYVLGNIWDDGDWLSDCWNGDKIKQLRHDLSVGLAHQIYPMCETCGSEEAYA